MGSLHRPKNEPPQAFCRGNENASVKCNSPTSPRPRPRVSPRPQSISTCKIRQLVEEGSQEVTTAGEASECAHCGGKKYLHDLGHNVAHDAQIPSIPSTVPSLEGHQSDGLSDGFSVTTEDGATSLDQKLQFLPTKPMMHRYLNENGDRISGLFAWGSGILREGRDSTAFSNIEDIPSLDKPGEVSSDFFKTAELNTYRSTEHLEPLVVYGARTRISKHENEPWDLQSGLQATQPLRTPNRVRTKPSKSHSRKKGSSSKFLNAIEDQVHFQRQVPKAPFAQISFVTSPSQKEVGDMTGPTSTPSSQNHKGYSSTFKPTPKLFQRMNPSSVARSDPSGSSLCIAFGSVSQGIETHANYKNTMNAFHDTPNQAIPYPEVVNGPYCQTSAPYESYPSYMPNLGAQEPYPFAEFYDIDNIGLPDIVATGAGLNSAFQSSFQDQSVSHAPSLLADESSPLSGVSAIDSLSNRSGPSKGLEHHGSLDPSLLPIEPQQTWSLESMEPATTSKTLSSEELTNFNDYIEFKAASNK